MSAVNLTADEQQHVMSAQGWVELGSPDEAFEELDHIAAERRTHPDVLEVRWNAYYTAQQWAEAVEVARVLTTTAPQRFSGWWQLSVALHEMNRTQEAYENLASVRERFDGEFVTHYNLARYLVQLGRVREGRRSLMRAFEINPGKRVAALEDPDLEPLRSEIEWK